MTEYINQKPRVDSRGLPEGYDPHYFYEYSISKRSKEAVGLEGLIYKWIPHSLIKSFAFAIDPFSQFKVSTSVVTPVNRTRELFKSSLLDQRTWYRYNFSQTHNFKSYAATGHNGPTTYDPPVTSSNTSILTPTVGYYGRIKDTSRRTRLLNSNTGEFELFKVQTFSSSRQLNYVRDSDDIYISGTDGSIGHSGTLVRRVSTASTAAYFQKSRVNGLRDSEIALANSMLAKMAIPMYKGINPQHRSYSLVRNLIELRDLPRSVVQLRTTVQNLARLNSALPQGLRRTVFGTRAVLKDIPNEYLSYHFGWKQTLSDLLELVAMPQKISKQLNFLMSRSGKATTYRSRRTDVTSTSGASGFTYDVGIDDYTPKTESRIERNHEYRMVINSTFTFPPADVPRFREKYFTQKLGATATVTDFYNLVPWTWLIDWFTGLGNYVEIIDEVNRDQSLINWGFITLVTKGSLITEFTSTTTCTRGGKVYPPPPQTQFVYGGDYKVSNHHTSVADFTVHIRKSLANVMNVNLVSDPHTLSAYQNSILGALISQRSKYWSGH